MTNPATGEPGALVRFLDADGNELYREDRRATALIYFRRRRPIRTAATFEVSPTWTPETSGQVLLGYAATGRGRVFVDGELRREDVAEAEGMDLGADPRSARGHDPGDGNRHLIDVRIEYDLRPAFWSTAWRGSSASRSASSQMCPIRKD